MEEGEAVDPPHSLHSLLMRYARPQALLARAPAAVMLAYLRSPAFPAIGLLRPMFAFFRWHRVGQDVLLADVGLVFLVGLRVLAWASVAC